MIRWSVLVGVLGVLGAGLGMARLRAAWRSPHGYWLLGLVGLLPGWLIAFVGLLGPSPDIRPEPRLIAAFIASSAAGLLGLILTEAAVRRLAESGHPYRPLTYWLLGGAALLPAWGFALLGLGWARP